MASERSPSSSSAEKKTITVIRTTQTYKKLGISRAQLHKLCAQGLFPKPFPLVPGGRAVGWIEGDVDEWILARKASSKG